MSTPSQPTTPPTPAPGPHQPVKPGEAEPAPGTVQPHEDDDEREGEKYDGGEIPRVEPDTETETER